jgi:hypothetical protein
MLAAHGFDVLDIVTRLAAEPTGVFSAHDEDEDGAETAEDRRKEAPHRRQRSTGHRGRDGIVREAPPQSAEPETQERRRKSADQAQNNGSG